MSLYREVSSVKQFNQYWAEAKARKIPIVVIEPRTKICTIKYDMFTINYDLTPDAVKKVQQLFYELLDKAPPQSRWFSYGEVSGYLPKLPIELAREYLPKLADIVTDPANWKPIGGD